MTQARIFLTRPAQSNQVIANALNDLGLDFALAPALSIDLIEQTCPVPNSGELVIFVSRNAVNSYFQNQAAKWPKDSWACAVGNVTANELKKFLPIKQIIAPDLDTKSDSEALLQLISKHALVPSKAYIMRAESGRNWLSEKLQKNGWQTQFYTVYKRTRIMWDYNNCNLLVKSNPAILLLTSQEAFNAIDASLKSYNLKWPDNLCVITLHARITSGLQQKYKDSDKILNVTVTKPDDESLLKALLTAYNKFHK